MLHYTVVEGSWATPDTTEAEGTVEFVLSQGINDTDSGESVPAVPSVVNLVAGAIAQALVANDAPGSTLVPPTTAYWTTESIVGSPDYSYWITVPAVPEGARRVTDGVATQGQFTLASATADFTDDDVGSFIFCPAFPVGTTIRSVTDSGDVVLSGAASRTASGLTVVVGASVTLASLRALAE